MHQFYSFKVNNFIIIIYKKNIIKVILQILKKSIGRNFLYNCVATKPSKQLEIKVPINPINIFSISRWKINISTHIKAIDSTIISKYLLILFNILMINKSTYVSLFHQIKSMSENLTIRSITIYYVGKILSIRTQYNPKLIIILCEPLRLTLRNFA